jgi:hypothetical protein
LRERAHIESPERAYGRLLEGVHVAGYTFERACANLESLLIDDRWRKVGGGYDDVNKFLASIRFDEFRVLAEQRKRLAARIKALQPAASNRAIAGALGVDEKTIRRDGAANAAPESEKQQASQSGGAANAAPVARGEREILRAAKQIRAEKTAARRAEWTARTIELSNHNAPLPRARRYPIILGDPPWKFEVYDEESGLERAAAAHYPTMEIEEICALPVANLATPDAALFLWVTCPHLFNARQVIESWGFTYCTNIVCVKQSPPGLGHWVRNKHEILIIATRGGMRCPPEAKRPDSVITAPRRAQPQAR